MLISGETDVGIYQNHWIWGRPKNEQLFSRSTLTLKNPRWKQQLFCWKGIAAISWLWSKDSPGSHTRGSCITVYCKRCKVNDWSHGGSWCSHLGSYVNQTWEWYEGTLCGTFKYAFVCLLKAQSLREAGPSCYTSYKESAFSSTTLRYMVHPDNNPPKFSSRRPDALFWPPGTPSTHVVHIHMWR